jgi:hypothetical protein
MFRKDQGSTHLFSIQNIVEKRLKDCIAPYRDFPDAKLIVWAYFWGSYNSIFYPMILKSVVYRYLRQSASSAPPTS